MTAEKPKKPSKTPFLVAGALAATALGSALLLREGQSDEARDIQNETKNKVARIIADAGVAKRMAVLSADRIIPTETTAADLAFGYDTNAAQWLLNKILEEILSQENAGISNREEDILKKYGISQEDFYALVNGDNLRRLRETLNHKESLADAGEMADQILQNMLKSLFLQAEDGDPFHPFFLAQLGMKSEEELKDLIQIIISYVERYEKLSNGERIQRLKDAYNI